MSAEVKPGYKQTTAGIIPEEWDAMHAGEVGIFRGGNGFPIAAQGAISGDFPFFKVSDMNNQGNEIFMTASNNYISDQARKNIGATIFPAESIIFAKVGAAVFLERKKILSQQSCIDNNLAAFVIDKAKADTRYIHSLLLTKKLGDLVATTALPALSSKQLNELPLAIPPLPEQQIISSIVSDLDQLIRSMNKLITKKCDIQQASMQQLLTGQLRLPGFSGAWETRSLLEIAENKKALFDDGDWVEAEHITNQGVRLVQTGNIGVGHFVEKTTRKYIYETSFKILNCKELKIGDILICRLAEPAGRACIFPDIREEKVITSVDVTIFRPNPEIANRNFLVQLFSTSSWFKSVLDQVGGTTHKRISRGALGRIKVSLPRVEEQAAIATILSDMNIEIAALEARRDKARQMKLGMMQELLTGRIRLV
ncbi:restriction endonuclease subunit S [Stutzerimonas stutzeri]|uniref:restriction endonuclease subunit S n=1 Tax=Stutzerimonas stutzeri TaxID=316 RepID=UPI003EE3FF12